MESKIPLNHTSNYLSTLAKPLLCKLGFDFVRVWFRSVDGKAMVCHKLFKDGKVVNEINKIRLLIESSPYTKSLFEEKKIKVFDYPRDKATLGVDPNRVRLGKEKVDKWIEVPIYCLDTDSIIGMVCLINTKQDMEYKNDILSDLENYFNSVSKDITHCMLMDRHEQTKSLLERLAKIDQILLWKSQSISPLEPWKIIDVYKSIMNYLFDVTGADVICFYQLDNEMLIPLAYKGKYRISDMVLDLKNPTHQNLITAKPLTDKESDSKFHFYIGKDCVQDYLATFDGNFYDSQRSKKLLLSLRSAASLPVRSVFKTRGVLVIASKDYDFLNDINEYAIINFAEKLGMIMSLEERVASLLNSIEQKEDNIDQLKDSLNMQMNVNIRYIMARAMMHEIGNIITPINLAFSIVKDIVRGDEKLMTKKNIIPSLEAIEVRLSRMNRMLETYKNARSPLLSEESVYIADIIEETMKMCLYQLDKEGITSSIRLDDDKIQILVSRIELVIVFYNLIINAIDAMRRHSQTVSKRLIIRGQLRKKYYVVDVEDRGCGIKEEIKSQIFNLDFSTKLNEGGTGMGLFLVQQLLKRRGGKIRIKSTAVGKGTTFEVKIPIKEG